MRPAPIALPDKIPLLTPKDAKLKPLRRSFFNLILLTINALLRFEVGPGLRLTKSPGRYLLELDDSDRKDPPMRETPICVEIDGVPTQCMCGVYRTKYWLASDPTKTHIEP